MIQAKSEPIKSRFPVCRSRHDARRDIVKSLRGKILRL